MDTFQAKVQYAIDQGAGGIMLWELAGDYSTPEQNGLGHHYFGSTFTDTAYNMLKDASPYGIKAGDESFVPAAETLDVDVDLVGFMPVGEANYPLQIAVKLTNNSDVDLTGAKISFNVSPAVPLNSESSDPLTMRPYEPLVNGENGVTNIVDQYSGVVISASHIAESGTAMGNVGGLSDDFHRYVLTLKDGEPNDWDGELPYGVADFASGETIDVGIRVYMPMPVPTDFTFEVDGKTYGITADK
ncbi:chitinase C-terminal domain-containing protein [Psychromonas ossibalaenae]|uniref:chitinase C-terminal domain-containing protein n=1 Tax=Psychromonas ossibalaenae TaxID=444922 RepID=UPI0003A21BE3|nr:chitinase C-terminal domain-containing protein [Psychromonas ossibalaenae]